MPRWSRVKREYRRFYTPRHDHGGRDQYLSSSTAYFLRRIEISQRHDNVKRIDDSTQSYINL
uniref:Uncharacterized protein n=1 Tax=Romanomermis culicivorax TaxID=13658 RepID=A0A915IXP1_ROMCU